jgi:hypothetical protein
MPNRRYAILFLANGGYSQAVPTLEKVIVNSSESDIIRGDALEAIAFLDRDRSKKLAIQYLNNHGHLSDVANKISTSAELHLSRRTYFDALFRRHE